MPRLKTTLSRCAGIASAYLLPTMKITPLPTGFVVPAQPVKASKRPVGSDWVHEIKHDGYRIIVRRDDPTVRLTATPMTGRRDCQLLPLLPS
jgi:bifunctional non-homologous end joining protein LigD